MGAIRAAHGPDALAALASSRSTNEACYLLQKLVRAVLGTNNIDCCARVCHSSTATALRAATGTGAASACFDDIEQARAIVVAGANPTEAHPVVGARILQAALGGTPLIVIDPRRTELAAVATVHLPVAPGANVPLLNALARALLERGAVDGAYLAERTVGLEALAAHLLAGDATADLRRAEVGAGALDAAAGVLGAGPALFVHGLGPVGADPGCGLGARARQPRPAHGQHRADGGRDAPAARAEQRPGKRGHGVHAGPRSPAIRSSTTRRSGRASAPCGARRRPSGPGSP